MGGGSLHKDIDILTYTTSPERVLSEEYTGVDEHIDRKLKTTRQLADNIRSGELAISISTEDYIRY